MILRAIKRCLERAAEKRWAKTYWAFDIHGTLLKPNFRSDVISHEFYPHVKQVMKALSKRKDIVLILYTCSHPHEIQQYLTLFKEHGISFQYVNENPEVPDGAYGYYRGKFYFNLLFDDKAGFDPEHDWNAISVFLQLNSIV